MRQEGVNRSAVAVVRPETMTVDAAMTPHPVCIRRHAVMHEAAEIVAFSNATELMVVDDDGAFVGVLSALDILKAAMPDVDEITAEGGTVETALELFVSKGHTLAETPIEPVVVTDPITVEPQDHVGVAVTVFIDQRIRLLPVVSEGRLVGTISRADACRAVIGSL
ncbi:MAG TPA: CBS domain-containing protein [Gaiellaceae bacterium]